MFRIPELLAPAGGMEQLKAAVENGADAVYMGGKLFNARINASNFDETEMIEAIEYAHLKGVKLYITMNTMIKDRELLDALKYAAWLYEAGADALIVQDLGFAALVRENIPGFDLHLSTQGTIYNIEGVRQAKRLGFTRVVLARELSLAEIKEVIDESLLDVEVFAHGALCISYSGQCQMSREIGGRSGNRGECAQPCRLPYSIYRENSNRSNWETKGKAEPVEGSLQEVAGSSFALSPKDLCTIGQLGHLAEAGVASLKIEGRMKSAEYVAVVTGIYRKYLDIYAKQGRYKVAPSDIRDLSQVFNRGGFTEGYLFGNPKEKLMSGDLPKHQGIFIGKVVSSDYTFSPDSSLLSVFPSQTSLRQKGSIVSGKPAAGRSRERAGNRQRGLITIKLVEKLSVGDGIEIRNHELSGNIVTFMNRDGKKIESAGKGEKVTIGYIDGYMSPGDRVYKITDKELMKRAKASYEGKSSSAIKSMRKIDVSFYFTACLDKPLLLKAVDEEGNSAIKKLEGGAERAVTKATTAELVTKQLSKTGGTPFRVVECSVDIENDVAIPLSKINELRRAVIEELQNLRKRSSHRSVNLNLSFSGLKRNISPVSAEEISIYLLRVKEELDFDASVTRIYVPYDAILNGFYNEDDRAIPVIPNITKDWHDKNIQKNFDKIVAVSCKKGIAVGNLGWIEPFASSGVNVFGDYGLNLYNSMDFSVASELGIKEGLISPEADLDDILRIDFHGIIPEVVLSGKIPVMTSEHCIIGDLSYCGCKEEQTGFFLKDRKGQLFQIVTDGNSCRSVILSYKENNMLRHKDALKNAGIYRFRIYAG